jgi:hypothetical protein
MPLDFTTNADQVGSDLTGEVVDVAQAEADQEAADRALALIGPKTPRRTGALAAGLRSVVVPTGGFAIVYAVVYATVVDARTGFASETLARADAVLAEVYDKRLQAHFDQV